MGNKLMPEWKKYGMILIGTIIYAVGMNWFITPLNLFSSGCVGYAQLITRLIGRVVELGDFNLYGIIYMLLNIPLFVMAWKSIDHKFFVKTLIGVGGISFFSTIIPAVSQPLVDDILLSVMVGGILNGVGVGMILYAGGSSGGVDIVGVWAMKKYQGVSVGKISLILNSVLYICLLILFDVPTMLYSIGYLAFYTFVMDRMHYQNINVRLMVFTKKAGIDKLIVNQKRRGVTKWTGVGAYTEDGINVLVSCVSKYELQDAIDAIHKEDPHAFVIADEHVYVSGNFEKRIDS